MSYWGSFMGGIRCVMSTIMAGTIETAPGPACDGLPEGLADLADRPTNE